MNSFKLLFQVARHNQTQKAFQDLKGLLTLEKGKANMGRMPACRTDRVEEIPDSEYRAYQHFITHSEWGYKGVLSKVASDTSQVMKANKKGSKKPIGLIVDESLHLKKGESSVAVSRQYAGVWGKVDNCQVGVYASSIDQ